MKEDVGDVTTQKPYEQGCMGSHLFPCIESTL